MQELAFREGRLEKIREAMGALCRTGRGRRSKHPGVPDDKAQRDTESIIPAPGGKDFLQAYNCQAVVDSAHQVIVAARASKPDFMDKQQAAAMMEETIDNVGAVPREVDAGLLLGKGSRRALCSGRGPVRRAGADPPRPGCAIRAPRSHTQPSVPRDRMRRKLQTKRGRQRYAMRMQTVGAGIRLHQAGPGIPLNMLRGLELGVNGSGLDLHTGQGCSALGSICTGKHGSMGQPNASGTFAEVASTALFAKLSGGRPAQPAKLVVAIHCR